MGEISEAIINGVFCECCGGCIGDDEEPGFPRCCDLDCAKEMGYKRTIKIGEGYARG